MYCIKGYIVNLLYRLGKSNTRMLFTKVFMYDFKGGSKRHFSHLFELHHFFLVLSFLAFIYVWNIMSFGGRESLLQLKRKKQFHISLLSYTLEEVSEANENK